jgi:endo-1,3-1,4-beta-glycanase ExoK
MNPFRKYREASCRVFALVGGPMVALLVLFYSGMSLAGNLPFVNGYKIDENQWYIDDGWTNGDHQSCEWRREALSVHHSNMLLLTLSDKGGKVRPIGCPGIQYKKATGFGRYETRMRTAAGSGLNTAFFTYAGPPNQGPVHDEIDMEFMGKQTDTVDITVWTNDKPSPPLALRVPLGYDASKDFHNYAIEWLPDAVRFYADDKLIYETKKGDPIPSHPSYLYFTLWSGAKAEDAWMGHFTYTGPATAEVAWAKYTPAS